MKLILPQSLGVLLCCPAIAAGEFRFAKATIENTTLADGTPLKVVARTPVASYEITRSPDPAQPDNHWHWWEGLGTGAGPQRGVFTSAGRKGNNAPPLRTTVTELKPNTSYRVHGFFWIDAAAGNLAPRGDQCWDIRLGLALADMQGYGYTTGIGLPDTIGLAKDSDRLVKQSDTPLRTAAGEPAPDTDGSRCLFRANLGAVRTDNQGTLIVYADDQAHDTCEARTCYDGVGVTEDPDATAAAGTGSPVTLSRAVRAGDWEMMRRELAAGADPNTIDTEGRTPLFYLCAVGDYDRASALLKAGSKPDVPGQRMSPLWAAATLGDSKLTKLLLDAGAAVTEDNVEKHTTVPAFRSDDYLRYNPIAAAVGSGSVETLQLILDKKPGLDLEKAAFGSDFKSGEGFHELVSNAIFSACPEMAAFLTHKGYRIEMRESRNLPTPGGGGYVRTGSTSLMLRAVMNQPPMTSVIEALKKRGVPLVMMDRLEYDSVVVPWDALSAAVWDGNPTLVEQWLPLAKAAPEDYRILLTTLADACCNNEVATLVRRQFPEVKRTPYQHPYDPVENGRAKVAGKPGVFIPRTLATAPRKPADGTITLAVIPAPGAEGQGDALAANASNKMEWAIVERGTIDKLIAEKSLDRAAPLGTTELSAIGDGLSADIIVTVAKLGTGQQSVLCFEAANVRTGLPIDRVFIAANEFKPGAFSADYLARIRSRFASRQDAGRLTGITLLGVAPETGLLQGTTLGNLIHAGLLQAIDDTPGLIALTRDQMEPIATEKTLKDSGALWGAGWTLEGGLRKGEGDKVVLALRLNQVGSNGARHEVTADGMPDQLQSLVGDAWKKIAGLLEKQPIAVADPAGRATAEAARLLREAEWIANGPRNWEAAPLADAALYLGADPMKSLRLRMRCHWNTRHSWNPRMQWGSSYEARQAGGYPLRPEFHDYARRWVGEHLELLRLTSDTLDRVLAIYQNQPAQLRQDPLADFWENLESLTNYRCRLVPRHLDPDQRSMLTEYDAVFKELWAKMLPLVPQFHDLGEKFRRYEQITQHFRPMPWLGDMFAAEILGRQPMPGEYQEALLTSDQLEPHSFDSARPETMAAFLCRALENSQVPHHDLRLAEINFLRAAGDSRSAAAMAVAKGWIASLADSLTPPAYLVSREVLGRSLPVFDSCNSYLLTPAAGDLPALISSPVQAPDMIFRFSAYDMARRRFGLAIEPNSPLWQRSARYISSTLDRQLNELVRLQAQPRAFDVLLERAADIDATYPCKMVAYLRPKIETLRPKGNPQSFGSKGQFPIIINDGALQGKLLTDVRQGVTAQAGLITRAMIDPADRNLLWLAIHPQTVADLPVHRPKSMTPQTYSADCKPPWLLAIDCRDGNLVRKVNLAEAGFSPESAAKDSAPQEIGGFLAPRAVFNEKHLMMCLFWHGEARLVVLNRETGETTALPKLKKVVDYQMVATNGSAFPAMGGIGNAFYVLEDTREGKQDANFNCNRALWQFIPGKEPRQLVHPGRRPPDSPFDDEDRRAQLLRVDDDKLLLASSWEHLAHYDPATDKWLETPGRTPREWQNHVLSIDTKDLHATLFPHHRFANDDGRVDTFGGPDESKPGCLVFAANGKEARLPISLAVPDSYQGGFMLSANIPDTAPLQRTPPERVSATDLARSNMVCPVILNQTAEHFVIGLRLRIWGGILSATEPTYLPFLWIIDKKTMRAGMNAQFH